MSERGKMKLKMEKDLLIRLIAIGVIGTVLIIVGAIFIFTDKTPAKKPANKEMAEELEEVEQEEQGVELERALGLVVGKDNGVLDIYDIEKQKKLKLNFVGKTTIEDEYGKAIVADSLLVGYIVNLKYDKKSFDLESVKIAAQIQVLEQIPSLKIDENLKTIQIGSDIYQYTDQLIALDGDKPLVLADLTPADQIKIRAYKSTIWSIIVEGGHGYIVLKNYEAYLEGLLEVGNRQAYTIEKEMRVPVALGSHKVIISKDDMSSYTETVFIEEGKDYVIDLADLQPKTSEVTFNIAQEETKLFVNDQEITDFSKPTVLDFGEYTVKATNKNYLPWEEKVVVNKPIMSVTINMEVKPYYLYMTGPAGAEFYIDGIFQGNIGSGALKVPIKAGDHLLTLRKSGYVSWSQNIVVDESKKEYYYTVSELTKIPEPTTTPDPNNGNTTPGQDVYGGNGTDSGQ